jgi:hypothetical protein
MRHPPKTVLATVVMTVQVLSAQAPMKPTAPGTPGDPAWQGIVRLNDGRTFVTDGGLAFDAAIAKPAKPPDREVPGKVLQTYLDATYQDEYGFSDLKAAASGKTYRAPNGIALNATYINYLRRKLSAAAVRLRMSGELQPVLILANGKTVGVLMPVRQ